MPKAISLRSFILGAALGFVLSSLGFSHFDEMMKMLTFSDLRLLLTFGGAVLLGAIAFKIDRGVCRVGGGQASIKVKTIIGAAIFGVGWALIGACPAVPVVQLGEGKLFAILSALGMLTGMRLAHWMIQRFGWSRDSCV